MAIRTTELFLFIRERHNIWLKRQEGLPKPWTADPILQNYRFCNVYRELDKVTVWITKNWRDKHQTNPDVWFAMAVARLFNNPNTLGHLRFPVPFDVDSVQQVLSALKLKGEKIFNAAYIVSTNGMSKEKSSYVVENVLTPLWKAREVVRPRKGDSLFHFFSRLTAYRGFSTFMGAQVVADVKYTPPLYTAVDWNTFAASGPGSRRGLNRVYNYDPESNWTEKTWYTKLIELRMHISDSISLAQMPPLSAQDLQNCLCEFDKYERVRLGQGKPKQRYNGEAA